MQEIFEKASRMKLRFDSLKGSLSVEDLWDLPLTSTVNRASLDTIAIGLNRQLKETSNDVSFVRPVERTNTELQLKFDVVKRIIDVRVAERDAAKAASDRDTKKQQLLEILARKENQELEGKSAEELRAMVNSL